MQARKTLVAAATVGAFMAGGAAVASVNSGGSQQVAPVDLSNIVVASTVVEPNATVSSTPVTVEPGESNQLPVTASSIPARVVGTDSTQSGVVPGLQEKRGVIGMFGDDFALDGRELDFGPDRWMIATVASGDLDRDDTVESWWDEVSGSVGRTVTVLGDVDDDDIDVFQIGGLAVRPLNAPAPWSGNDGGDREDDERLPTSTKIDMNKAMRLALEQVPGSVIAVELDIDEGIVYWELEVRSTSGALYDVEIDANSGRIIEVDRD